VLDVGCGTGTLAIAAKRKVGPAGKVVGVDASSEMLARAQNKATKAALDIDFRMAVAEALPFADATFDAAVCTTVLHCLSEDGRRSCIAEMIRVLRPGGRLLLVDFGGPARARHSMMSHLHQHKRFDLFDLVPLLRECGVLELQSGPLGFSDLQFTMATTPSGVQ
jgi:ubiquinone/menaquinone biosynthesis C-methylase UbiE